MSPVDYEVETPDKQEKKVYHVNNYDEESGSTQLEGGGSIVEPERHDFELV